MQYSLLIYQTDAQFAARTDPARRDANTAAFMQFVGALNEAGILVTTLGIEPPKTATTVRPGGDAPRVQAGPYAETKEQLGGRMRDRGARSRHGRRWARRAPFEHCGPVEVRPTRVVPSA